MNTSNTQDLASSDNFSDIYMLCGLPGSGKSTLANYLHKYLGAEIVSSDEIREELFGDAREQKRGNQVFDIARNRVNDLIANHKDIIIDATNLTPKYRSLFLDCKTDGKKIAYAFHNDPQLAEVRNAKRFADGNRSVPAHVIEKMAEKYLIPSTGEGFNEIRGGDEALSFFQTYDHSSRFKEEHSYDDKITMGIIMHEHLLNCKNKRDCINICDLFQNKGFESYLVGGCVRDMYLGRTPHDFDITTNASTDQIKARLSAAHIPFTTVGEKYGTIVARIADGREYEITTYRQDQSYEDGRHPTAIKPAATLYEDLSRRDFTINAMAYDPVEKQLIDPFGGQHDCDKKLIKAVGNPDKRFAEDGLRIMRAMRFAVTLGFGTDVKTFEAMINNRARLDMVSKERITDEFRKIFTSKMPVKDTFTTERPIIAQIIPELQPEFTCAQHSKYHKHDVYQHTLSVVDNCNSDKFEIKLAALLHDIGKPATKSEDKEGWDHFIDHPKKSAQISEEVIQKNLRLTNKEKDLVISLVKEHDQNFSITEKRLRKAIFEYGKPFVEDLAVLRQADFEDHTMPKDITQSTLDQWYTPYEKTQQMLTSIYATDHVFSLKDMVVGGNELQDLGFVGPQIGAMLNDMLEKIVDGDLVNDRENLIEYAASCHDYLVYHQPIREESLDVQIANAIKNSNETQDQLQPNKTKNDMIR